MLAIIQEAKSVGTVFPPGAPFTWCLLPTQSWSFASLYVRVGGSDAEWQPSHSNYRDYREYAAGSGWKVWVKLPGNPPVKQAALAGALPVPVYKEPGTMQVPDALVGE